MSKNDTGTVVPLRHLNLCTMLRPGDGDEMHAILNWAKKLFDSFYEVGVSYTQEGGGHTWFAEIEDGQFKFISCAQYLSPETMAIMLKLEELEREKENQSEVVQNT